MPARPARLLFAGCLAAVMAGAFAQPPAPAFDLAARLSPEQQALVERAYPGAQLVSACGGNFSGKSAQELVLGLLTPEATEKQRVIRVGLVLAGDKWTLHDVDQELLQDERLSHSFTMDWPLSQAGEYKCSAAPAREIGLNNAGKPLGRAFFTLPAGRANACFATSDTYNNWDCVAYSASQRRFRLWYQQAFAD
jgi:hypothetical protein